MTSRLIASNLFDRPFSPVRAKVKCCRSREHFTCCATGYSVTRIPSSSSTSRHPRPTCGLASGGGLLRLCRSTVGVFYSSSIDLMSRVFPNGPEDQGSVPGWVIPNVKKWYLMTSLLNTQHYKAQIKDKVEQSREWSSSYWKCNLWVTLDYRRHLYLLIC